MRGRTHGLTSTKRAAAAAAAISLFLVFPWRAISALAQPTARVVSRGAGAATPYGNGLALSDSTCSPGSTCNYKFGSVMLGSVSTILQDFVCLAGLETGQKVKIKKMTLTGDAADFKITSNTCTGFVFNETNGCGSPGQWCEVDYEFAPEIVGHLKAESHPVFNADVTYSTQGLLGTGDFAISLAPQNSSLPNDFPLANPAAASPGSVPMITFSTTVGKSQTAKWKYSLSYITSGGLTAPAVAGDKPPDFETKGSGSKTVDSAFPGLGGEMAVSATAAGISNTATGYVSGILASAGGVPDSLITTQLGTLYDKLTCSAPSCPTSYQTSNSCAPSSTCQPYQPDTSNPILLAQVAMEESSYAQFSQETLYGVDTFWPHESPEAKFAAGAYIGLMMVPLSMGNAWNWLTNTSAGAAVFQGDLVLAAENAAEIQDSNTGLADLNPEQLENMALVLYNQGTGVSLTGQYYIPQCTGTVSGETCSSGWQWVPNTAGNSAGVNYVCDPANGTGVRNQTPSGLSAVPACVQ
jgi:hypothetical protein